MSLKTSLRVLDKTTPVQDDSTSVFKQSVPWIERLIKTPEGIGLMMILAGVLLRMTHTPGAPAVTGFQGPPSPVVGDLGGGSALNTPAIPASNGLDQVVFHVTAEAVGNLAGNIISNAGPIQGIETILGFLGVHVSLTQSVADAAGNAVYPIYLSDLLIICGAGTFLGSTLTSIVPKV